jgi:hypothetical protein
MATQTKTATRIFMALIALVAWFALVLQLSLMLALQSQTGLSVLEVVIKFLSFFTILSNTIVAVSLTLILLKPQSGLAVFFAKPANKTAVAVYILVVGIVYNLILRALWAPTGWQRVADELLHVAVPLLYLIYWLFFVPKGYLQWKTPINWLLYPICYLIYSIIRGAVTKFYPYPFIDVNQLGYGRTLINAGLMFLGFLLLGLLFVGMDKLSKPSVEK